MIAGEVLARLTVDDTDGAGAAQQRTARVDTARGQHPWARKAAEDTTGSLAALQPLPTPSSTPELTELHEELAANPRLEELTGRWFAPPPAWLKKPGAGRRAQSQIEANLNASWPSDLLQTISAPGGGDRPVARPGRREVPQAPPPNPPRPDRCAVLPAAGQSAPRDAADRRAARGRQAPVVSTAEISQVVDVADACEVTALTLLDPPADLTAERWAGLALVLAFAKCDVVDHDQRVLLLAPRPAGPAPPSRKRCQPRYPPCHRRGSLTSSRLPAETGLGDQVDQAVLAWAASPDPPVKVWCSTMQALAPHDRPSLPVLTQLTALADQASLKAATATPSSAGHKPSICCCSTARRGAVPIAVAQILASSRCHRRLGSSQHEGRRFQPVRAQSGRLLAHCIPDAHPASSQATLCPPCRLGMVDVPSRRTLDFPGAWPGRISPDQAGAASITDSRNSSPRTSPTPHPELQGLVTAHPEQPDLPELAAEHARRVSENLRR